MSEKANHWFDQWKFDWFRFRQQISAQHWLVAVPKMSVGGQSLGQNWPPSAYRSYHSSHGIILATDLQQNFCRCWASVGPYLTSHLGTLKNCELFNKKWVITVDEQRIETVLLKFIIYNQFKNGSTQNYRHLLHEYFCLLCIRIPTL